MCSAPSLLVQAALALAFAAGAYGLWRTVRGAGSGSLHGAADREPVDREPGRYREPLPCPWLDGYGVLCPPETRCDRCRRLVASRPVRGRSPEAA